MFFIHISRKIILLKKLKKKKAFSLFVYPDAALSVDTFEQGEFSVYPNPVNDQLTIKSKVTVDQVTLYNMMGQKVMQQQPNGLDVNMNLAHLNKGIYFVEVKTGNHVKTVKVLKN